MQREATCACGQMKIKMEGDPKFVALCNCLKCQRRTGSAFGMSAYFDDEQIIETAGETKKFVIESPNGGRAERSFCPTCGTAVYWATKAMPGKTAVAVGCFSDPQFPQPMVSVWESSKHPWLGLPDEWHRSDQQDLPGVLG